MALVRTKFARDPQRERQQLGILALGFGALAGVLALGFAAVIAPAVLAGLALLAGLGFVAFPWLGRDLYLLFALASSAVGGAVSRVVVGLVYGIGIGVFGSLLRLFGMNRLDRNFARCQARESMFRDAPSTDRESFGRQS